MAKWLLNFRALTEMIEHIFIILRNVALRVLITLFGSAVEKQCEIGCFAEPQVPLSILLSTHFEHV